MKLEFETVIKKVEGINGAEETRKDRIEKSIAKLSEGKKLK